MNKLLIIIGKKETNKERGEIEEEGEKKRMSGENENN